MKHWIDNINKQNEINRRETRVLKAREAAQNYLQSKSLSLKETAGLTILKGQRCFSGGTLLLFAEGKYLFLTVDDNDPDFGITIGNETLDINTAHHFKLLPDDLHKEIQDAEEVYKQESEEVEAAMRLNQVVRTLGRDKVKELLDA